MRLLQSKYRQPMTGTGLAAEGRLLVSGGKLGYETWDTVTSESAHFSVGDAHHIFAFVVDPVGRWLYFSGSGVGCCCWSLQEAKVLRLPGGEPHVIALATSRDGSRFAVSRGTMVCNRLECWSVGEEDRLSLVWSVPFKNEGVSFRAIAFHPQGHCLASIDDPDTPAQRYSDFHSIVVRDVADGTSQAKFGSLPYPLSTQMTYSPDGLCLFVWQGGELRVYSVAEQNEVGKLKHPRQTNIQGLAFHPSGRFFATVANDGAVRFWDPATLKRMNSLDWKIGKLLSVAFSSDGMLAAAGGENGQVVLWDVDL